MQRFSCGAGNVQTCVPPALSPLGSDTVRSVHHIVLPGDEGFPFSRAVLDGDPLYVAGQLSADDAGWAGPATIEAETETAMSRIGRILDAVGASFADVMRVGVFMVDCIARVRSGADS